MERPVKFIDVELDGLTYRARLLEERSPRATRALWEALPFEGRAVHGIWSGDVFRMLEDAPFAPPPGDAGAGFQYPGLVVLEPSSRELAICYGQGRLNLPTGPANPIPLAELGGDLAPLARRATQLQFDGARPIRWRRSDDQTSPLAGPPAARGRTIEVEFDGALLSATLLKELAPRTADAFARALPLAGRATNTHSSGTLARFWNDEGGDEGETPLDIDDGGPFHIILYPGTLYYLPSRPWRGIRIPYETTAMGGAASRGTTRLVPFARFDGDWSAFRERAMRLSVDGAKPLAFRLRG